MRRIFLSYHHRDDLEAEVFCRRYEGLFDEIRRLGIPDEDAEQDLADHVDIGDADYVMRRIREEYIARSCGPARRSERSTRIRHDGVSGRSKKCDAGQVARSSSSQRTVSIETATDSVVVNA